MKSTIVKSTPGGAKAEPTTKSWEPFQTFDDKPLTAVELIELATYGPGQMQLVSIARGGNFVMHTSPEYAFCMVVRGKGILGLPGNDIAYEGPELFIFEPGALHDWHDIEQDTLLAVCLVDTNEQAT